jgi:tRNA A37 threonylcarbamoyladenosine dehydratase
MFTFLDQRKQAEVRWLQDPNQSSADNLNRVRLAASRHFRNKKEEYMKAKINELETDSKVKMSDTCVGASVILRRVTSLELI